MGHTFSRPKGITTVAAASNRSSLIEHGPLTNHPDMTATKGGAKAAKTTQVNTVGAKERH